MVARVVRPGAGVELFGKEIARTRVDREDMIRSDSRLCHEPLGNPDRSFSSPAVADGEHRSFASFARSVVDLLLLTVVVDGTNRLTEPEQPIPDPTESGVHWIRAGTSRNLSTTWLAIWRSS